MRLTLVHSRAGEPAEAWSYLNSQHPKTEVCTQMSDNVWYIYYLTPKYTMTVGVAFNEQAGKQGAEALAWAILASKNPIKTLLRREWLRDQLPASENIRWQF